MLVLEIKKFTFKIAVWCVHQNLLQCRFTTYNFVMYLLMKHKVSSYTSVADINSQCLSKIIKFLVFLV